MQSVLRELRRRGVQVADLRALECFAFDGHMHTIDYAPLVRALEVWEINPAHEAVLRRTFPAAVVHIADTYRQVEECTDRFSLIVVDNSPVHGGHTEHFDLLPKVFRLAADDCYMVLDIIPKLNASVRGSYPEMFWESTLNARKAFYGVDDPEHMTPGRMEEVYTAIARQAGFSVSWSFRRRRNNIITYLVLALARHPLALGMTLTQGFLVSWIYVL
jgi:nitrate reductase NapE component